MIREISLRHFKGFKRYRVILGRSAIVMGPNNAGKSTIINAARLASASIALASRERATHDFTDLDMRVFGFPMSRVRDDGFEFDNIRHELVDEESRVDVVFDNKAKLHMVWPKSSTGFFWVELDGANLKTAKAVKDAFHELGVIPVLTPVERAEKKLSTAHLSKHVDTRLSSRQFRNQVRALQEKSSSEFSAMKQFMLDWTPEITDLSLVESWGGDALNVDLYFREASARSEREIFWAGDGLQIWLQLLFQLWRTKEYRAVVLDEPDVFLHPDLQRRLVRLIEGRSQQVVLSSHAAEVAGEAAPGSLVWVDRKRSSSRRVQGDVELESFTEGIGSGFNLGIAKALRSKVTLFVEGHDAKILRKLAAGVGATQLANEQGVAIVPIGGFSNWPNVEAFGWLKTRFLGSQVKVRLILDSDYRTLAESGELVRGLADRHVTAHVWVRKEIESYLLEVPVLARVSGIAQDKAAVLLRNALDIVRPAVQAQYLATAVRLAPAAIHDATTIATANKDFEIVWGSLEGAVTLAPAKDVFSAWNRLIGEAGGKTISFLRLAGSIKPNELDYEVISLLRDIESDL